MLRLKLEEILMIILKKKCFSQLNHNICLEEKRINGGNRLITDLKRS